MEKLAKYIESLLEDNECIVLPAFGGILVNKVSAKIDPVQHKFVPPSVMLSFNPKLRHNDGLLIHLISDQERISYEEAKSELQSLVTDLKEKLEFGETVTLSGVGKFYMKAGVLLFNSGNATDLDKEAYGLTTFHAVPVKRVVEQVEKNKVSENLLASNRKNRKSAIRYVGYSIAVLPLFAYLVWVPTQSGVFNKHEKFHTSDLNPFSDKNCIEYLERRNVDDQIEYDKEENFLNSVDLTGEFAHITFEKANEEKKLIVELNKLGEKKVRSEATAILNSLPYHLIAGCFKLESNAVKFVEELKKQGFNAYVLDRHKGLYRVSSGNYESQFTAKKGAFLFKSRLDKASWVLKK